MGTLPPMTDLQPLTRLTAGAQLVVGGRFVYTVSPELAARFAPGDLLRFVEPTSEVLHIPAEQQRLASEAVGRARAAFAQMRAVTAEQIAAFYVGFAERLEDDALWAEIAKANAEDVATATARGRSTTRLQTSEKMRRDMAAGLMDAPWPPVYPKQPNEPPRVAPSRAKADPD